MSELLLYKRDASFWANPSKNGGLYHVKKLGDLWVPACGKQALLLDDSAELATELEDYQVCTKAGCWNRYCFAKGECPSCRQSRNGYTIRIIIARFTGTGFWGKNCDEQETDPGDVKYPKFVQCNECKAKFNIDQATGAENHESVRTERRERRAAGRDHGEDVTKPEHVRRDQRRGQKARPR